MKRGHSLFSMRIGRFRADRRTIGVLVLAAILLSASAFIREHPQHNPWAPLDLRDPPGLATKSKLFAMRSDTDLCRAVLSQSAIAFDALPPSGDGACARTDRIQLRDYPFAGAAPSTTCPVGAALQLWMDQGVQPAALAAFGQQVQSVSQIGTYSCRRLYGRDTGRWSEHATGNAIDIAAFTLMDGTQINILSDWKNAGNKSAFLIAVRDAACPLFGTVLSPDYNEAHRDHFHFDQAKGNWGVCR